MVSTCSFLTKNLPEIERERKMEKKGEIISGGQVKVEVAAMATESSRFPGPCNPGPQVT